MNSSPLQDRYALQVIFIDEAQLSEKLFKALRVFIDQHRDENFQVMFSGSSSPQLLSNIAESLAGRVIIFDN